MPEIAIPAAGLSYPCGDDDTVLRAALRAGLGFPYACNVGSCGNCRFELLEGAVEHRRTDAPAWTERDRQRRRHLGCQARAFSDCRIKVSLSDAYRSAHPPRRTRATLQAVEDVTHDIREFRFRLAVPHLFLPGQYALLSMPDVEGPRPYSMCNLAGDGGEWHFQIKRLPGGAATERLFAGLRIGDAVDLDGPYGIACFREDADRDILCLAGGSGLSPMVAIARAAAASPRLASREIHFVYGGRYARDICGEPMLRELPGYGERLFYHPVVSMPDNDPDGAGWTGRTGLVPDAAQALFGESLARFEVYFAGPAAMAAATMRMLHAMKVPPGQIHYDEFY